MNTSDFHDVSELSAEEREEYASVSWQIVLYCAIGLLFALAFDRLGLTGYLPDGLVRAITGSADTLGLTLVALFLLLWQPLRNLPPLRRFNLPRFGKPQGLTWIIGGLVGIVAAFVVQAIVYATAPDPYAPIGVVYAFAFSNLDNTLAGLIVLLFTCINEGAAGWRKYWRHPFFIGNAVMVIAIPLIALLVRSQAGFRPETNTQAGLESSLMDLDSLGAALIFIFATRVLKSKVPSLNDSMKDALARVWRRGKV